MFTQTTRLELDLPLDVGWRGIRQGSAGRAWGLTGRHSQKGEMNIFCSLKVAWGDGNCRLKGLYQLDTISDRERHGDSIISGGHFILLELGTRLSF